MALKPKFRERRKKFRFANVLQAPGTVKGPNGTFKKIRDGKVIGFGGSQFTESEGHPADNDGKRRAGGPFYTVKRETSIGSTGYSGRLYVGNAWWQASGQVMTPVPSVPLGFFPGDRSYDSVDTDSMNELGATAIAQVAPTNSASKVATLLGEIRKDGIPSIPSILLWKKRTELARSAGSEYLNYQFGWRPLVEEILQVGNAARHSRDICKQYQRDEGRNVRRTFEFPIEEITTSSTSSSNGARWEMEGSDLSSSFRGKLGATLTTSQSYSSRRWFSGAFTYALPSRTDSFRRMLGYGSEADKLFGITLSPDVVWELTPWSWAVDWFSNAGDVIHNATQFGLAGLVMRYGYMMGETSHAVTNSLDHMNLIGSETNGMPNSSSFRVEKTRTPANAFGFGFTGADLSPTQVAITVALGLTKL